MATKRQIADVANSTKTLKKGNSFKTRLANSKKKADYKAVAKAFGTAPSATGTRNAARKAATHSKPGKLGK